MPEITFADLVIHYELQGEGDVLVLFPDNLLASSAYQQEIDHFAQRYKVLAIDYPGKGKSSREDLYKDEQAVDLWGYWADLACHCLLELKIDACYALGIGGGALTGLHFGGKQAPQHQIRVKGLMLDSFLADWDSRKLHRWLDVREHFYVRNEKTLIKTHGEDWRDVVDKDTKTLRKLADQGGYQIPTSFLNAVACPTLLTGHMEDAFLPGIAFEYARISELIPDCSIYLSSKQTHPYIERPFSRCNPETFKILVDNFLGAIEK